MWWGNIVRGLAMRAATMPAHGKAVQKLEDGAGWAVEEVHGQGHYALLHPVVPEYESSRSTTKTRVEPAGISGEGDWLP